MATKIDVLDPKAVLEALTESSENYIITKKKTKKESQKCEYLPNAIKIKGETKPAIYRIKNVRITEGLPDPTSSAEKDGWGLKIATNLKEGGDYAKMIVKVSNLNEKKLEAMKASEEISATNDKVNPMVQTLYSKTCKIAEKKNKPILDVDGNPNPKVRLLIDFSKYPDMHPIAALRGTKQSIIYDYSTARIVKDAKTGKESVEYDEAKVGGVLLNKDNAYKFLTRGAMIVDGRIHADTTSISSFGISTKQLCGKLIIKRDVDVVFSDTTDDADDETLEFARMNIGNESTSSSTTTSSTTTTPVADNVTQSESVSNVLDDLMGGK